MGKKPKFTLFALTALVVALAALPASAQSPRWGTVGPGWGTPGSGMMMGPGMMDRREFDRVAAPVQPASPSGELTFSISS